MHQVRRIPLENASNDTANQPTSRGVKRCKHRLGGRLLAAFAAAGATIAALTNPAQAQLDPLRAEFVANVPGQPLGGVAAGDGSKRLFIVTKLGRIWIIDLTTNTRLSTPFLDVSSLISTNSERGLLGLAFDPDYENNGFFFIHYTNLAGSNVIARYKVSDSDPNIADPVAVNLLKIIPQDFSNHNGGDMAFGPDGMLYIGIGDGGSGNDPNNRAQDPNTLMGKLIRLDVNRPATGFVPLDNPFVNDPNTRSEIFALGLRNPWRLSFDRLTGDLYIADVGQSAREEVNFIPAGDPGGQNFGWDCREGFIPTPNNPNMGCDPNDPTLVDPIFEVRHSQGACSITGGYVYRGTQLSGWNGAYFYADYCGNFLRTFRYNVTTGITDEIDLTAQLGGTSVINGIAAMAQDDDGELYFISIFTGNVHKIVADTTACGCSCVLTGVEGFLYILNDANASDWTVIDDPFPPPAGNNFDGTWEYGTPVNDPNWAFGPIACANGFGQCFLTANRPGNSDVDNGATILISPQIDMMRGGVTICYDYFLRLNNTDGSDALTVEISSNGLAGPWIQIARHDTNGGLSWRPHAITQSELNAAGVNLTSNMRVRFIANDANPQSIVEAGLDNFKVYTDNPFDDCNQNGIPDDFEIAMGLAQDCNGNGIPDECDIASGLLQDCDGGPTGMALEGATFFNNNCIGCHGMNGLGGSGPNIRNKDRLVIQARLTFQIFHPGGQFDGSTPTDYANLEAFLADGPSGARPDGIPDICQDDLPDCNGNGIPDACEFAAGTLVDSNYDGLPDECPTATQCPCDIDNDGTQTVADYFAYLTLFFDQLGGPGSADFDGDGTVTVADFFGFLNCLPAISASEPCPT